MNINLTTEDQILLAKLAGYDVKVFYDKAVGDQILVNTAAKNIFDPYSPDACIRLMHSIQTKDVHSWGMLVYKIQSANKHQPIPYTVAHAVLQILKETHNEDHIRSPSWKQKTSGCVMR